MKQSTFSAQVANNLLTVLHGYSKTIRLLLVMFLTLTASTAWGESIEINTTNSTVNGSYRDYEFDVNSITFGCTQWMKNNNIQAKKSTTNSLYNVDAIPGTITSIVVKQTGTARAIKIYGGTASKPTTQITSPTTALEMTFDFTGKNYTYFSLTTPSNACYFDKITINYTPSGGGTTPDPEPTTTYTIKWHTSTTTSTDEELNEGATITKPATDPTMTGYEFMGWTEDCSVASDGSYFTALTDFGTATEDKDYYAVFAKATTTGGGGSTEDKEFTFNITKADFNTTSYAANNNEKTSTATASDGSTMDVKWTSYQVMNQNSTMQWQSSKGYIYNSTDLGTITDITITSSAGSFTKYINSSEKPTANGTGGYFQIKVGSATGKVSNIKVTFTQTVAGGGGTTTYDNYITTCAGAEPEPDPIPVTSVSLDKTSHTMNEGETVNLTATVTPDNADDKTVSWESDNEAVAKVNTNGEVTAVSPGTATITVTTTDGGKTATCAITVKALPTVEGTWTLVTNAANLKAGDRIVIAAVDSAFALSTTQNNNNRGQASVTKNGNTITFTEATQIITLETGTVDNTLAFNTGTGYLYAASSSSNHLKTQATKNDNGSWNISIDNAGIATVVAQGTNTRNTMQYNANDKLFACYSSASQKAIAIYKEGGGTTTYTITSTLSHVTADGGNPTTITSEDTELELSYSADTDWNLPENITITMGGNELTDSEYVWDNENGDLLIQPASGFTGNIVVTINGWQQLAAPTGLKVTNITSSGATLSWSAVANASSYTVFITDLDDEEITLIDIEKTSVDVTSLSSETLYLWDVVAIGDGINYTDSEHSSQEDPNAEFTTSAAATPTAGYTIIHHRQALDGNYIADSLVVKTTGTADVGSTITAEKKTYTGFVCNDAVQTITINADATQNIVTYKYVRQSYTLTWDLDGGTIVTAGTPAGTVKYGAPLTAPTVEKAGYRFDHWNPNVPATMQDGDRTYKAFYTQQHTVKWVSQGTVIRTDTYDTGAALEAAPTTDIVECDGKTHVGWTTQGGYAHPTAAPADMFTTSSGTVTADATYYALYAEGDGGDGGTGWTAVTSTSDLEVGATYAISNAADGGTYLSTYTGGNNFPGSTTTICPLILGGSEGAWTFQISDGSTHNDKYLTATSAASNRLKAVNPVDEWSYFTISFDGNAAVITCTGKNTNNILRYNANNGSPIFACYSSGQSDVYLQKQTGGGGYTNYTTSCATITDITIEGYTTEFKQYDEFVFGGTVYAIDDEDNKTDVTELATFNGYDMSQAGEQTVTVTYSGHQETYTITVTKLPVWNITWSVGGKTDTGIGPREVVQGKTIGECSSTGNLQIPKIPDACEGKYFMGWSASSTVNSDGSDFTPITSDIIPETNVTYYAVFAKPTSDGNNVGDLFHESFDTMNGKGGNDGTWNDISSSTDAQIDGWSFTKGYVASQCIRLGTGSVAGQATTPALGINGNATLTFDAGAWNGNSEKLIINLTIVGDGSIEPSSVTLTKGQFNTYTANITGANADTKVQFIAANAANNRFFLDEVKVSGGSSDSYTDYSTSCGTYTVTFYGFNSGGYTTTCNDNPAEIAVAQGETYQIPNCEPTDDPAGLGRTFAGTWNTQANGKGTEYEPGDEFIVNSDITLYAQWKLETTGNITLPADKEDLATTDIIVTGGKTLTIPEGKIITINSLTLKGGLIGDGKSGNYAMPSVWVPEGATLVRNNTTINLDLVVNSKSWYPFAVPFAATNNANVEYLEPNLAAASEYGTHFAIKTYDGARRAEEGVDQTNNWVQLKRNEKLQPGVGYIISALTYLDKDTATIRIPMSVPNEWLANGELTTVNEVTRNQVAVTAYTGKASDSNNGGHQRHAGWNFVANPYLSNFTGGGIDATNGLDYIDGKLIIQGSYEYSEETVPYVTIPAYNFAYYSQHKLSEAPLSPAYSFFVQVGTDGTMTFETAGRQQAPASIAARNAEERPVKMDVDITLSDNHSSDQTGIIISDRYSDAYEIGRDLEKLFGSAYNLSVYTLMADNTPLAFQALAIRSNMQVIPVGYRAPEQGEYTFRLNEATSSIDLLNEQYEQLVLVDYQTGELTNLLIADYTFYSERTQADNRFAIYAVPRQNAPTDLPNAIGQDKQAQKIIHNGHLYILRDGNVYNGNGQIVK